MARSIVKDEQCFKCRIVFVAVIPDTWHKMKMKPILEMVPVVPVLMTGFPYHWEKHIGIFFEGPRVI